jgi:hypothetical protein
VDVDFLLRRIRVEELPILLGYPHRNHSVRVERVSDKNLIIETGTLQAFEAAGQPKGLNLRRQLFEFRRVADVVREDLPGGAELDLRLFPADEHERSGGDQFVAQLFPALPFDEGEEPIG